MERLVRLVLVVFVPPVDECSVFYAIANILDDGVAIL